MSHALDSVRSEVRKLKPGQEIRVAWSLMKHIGPDGWRSVPPAEQVLEGIVGSAYEFNYRDDPENQVTVFRRLRVPLPTHQRTFVDPDRAHHFEKRGDIYQLIG